MTKNIVLVDFENVQPKNLEHLRGGPYLIKVFVGANQAKIRFELALAIQALGEDAEYVRIDGQGSNALDFHIAYYIGRLAAAHPDARFYVISNDKGFDPLIKHLKGQGIHCARLKSIADVPVSKTAQPRTAAHSDKADAVIKNLAKRTGKPRTLKTLRSTIKDLFKPQLTDEELEDLIGQLQARGVFKVDGSKVQYDQPP
jgi:hypothetical protein